MTSYPPAAHPTLHFIGVSTAQSSIMRVFPAWATRLGIGEARISGIDFPLHAAPAAYREAVAFLKSDPLTRGALVTTHKLDLFHACRDQFDEIDPLADLMDETSCLARRGGRLLCSAKDPITSGRALAGFLPARHFADTAAEVFAIGAGGSTIALTWYLMQRGRGDDVPARIVVSDRSPARLEAIRQVHAAIASTVPVAYVLAAHPADNDAVAAALPPGSLVINATGLGKDTPGSPLTDAARLPERGIAWDLNYRGNLVFLDQARAQAAARGLQVEDGWTYFIHGWSEVIAEVFALDAARDPAVIPDLAAIAARVAGR